MSALHEANLWWPKKANATDEVLTTVSAIAEFAEWYAQLMVRGEQPSDPGREQK